MNCNDLNKINGWFCPIDINIFDFILTKQNKDDIKGKMAEIGVFQGKSLAKICEYSDYFEGILAIDVSLINENIELIRQNIESILPGFDTNQIQFVCNYSKYLNSNMFTDYIHNTRFFHIDGGHSGIDTFNDINLAYEMLSNEGILVLDDFPNPMYPGVKEAYYTFIAKNPDSFRIILTSPSKAYCCKACMYDYYSNLINNHLYTYLKDNNFDFSKHSIIQNVKMVYNSYMNIIDKNPGINIYEGHTYNIILR